MNFKTTLPWLVGLRSMSSATLDHLKATATYLGRLAAATQQGMATELSLGGQSGAIILGLSLSKLFKLTQNWQSGGSAFKDPHHAAKCVPLPMFTSEESDVKPNTERP